MKADLADLCWRFVDVLVEYVEIIGIVINYYNYYLDAKLETQNRLGVEFKPSKRMKKRRELDALVNGSKQSSGARVKNGRHELLRNDSESSEVEEFSLPPNTAARKWLNFALRNDRL